MRRTYALSLMVTLIASGSYFYSLTSLICPIPLSYTIGNFDERFAITKADAQAAIAEAEQVWEKNAGRELFVYTDDSDAFPVNFIFDDRQERTIAEEIERQSLDSKESSSAAIAKKYEELTKIYTEEERTYAANVATYEARLQKFNTTVERYNAAGGAPPAEFATLEREEASLKDRAARIESESSDLAALAAEINALSEEGNRIIEQYNRGVQTYNRNFGHANEFTQGDYQGTSINIYTFSDRQELVTVLAHELGHALSIGHVENPTSVMYYLMGEQPDPLLLSAEDHVAYVTVCGQSDRFSDQLNRMFNLFISQFNL